MSGGEGRGDTLGEGRKEDSNEAEGEGGSPYRGGITTSRDHRSKKLRLASLYGNRFPGVGAPSSALRPTWRFQSGPNERERRGQRRGNERRKVVHRAIEEAREKGGGRDRNGKREEEGKGIYFDTPFWFLLVYSASILNETLNLIPFAGTGVQDAARTCIYIVYIYSLSG